MQRTPLRAAVLAVLAALTAFQLVGLVVALVSASRERVTDFGIFGPGLGGRSDLTRVRTMGGLPVDSVAGPALEAGLRPGDIILAIDGVSMAERPGVWYAGRYTIPPGTTLSILASRAGQPFPTTLRTRRLAEPLRWPVGPPRPDRPVMDYRLAHWWWYGPSLLMSLLLFVVGLVMGVLRLNDRTAWTFALVFLGISLATSIGGGTPLLHVWPPWLVLFWGLASIVGTAYSMPLTIHGLVDFPVPTRLSTRFRPYRWIPFAVLGMAGVIAVAAALTGYANVASPGFIAGLDQVAGIAFSVALALGFTTMGVLLASHRSEPAGSGGERLKVLWYGSMAAVLGGLMSVLVPNEFWHGLTRPFGTTGVWIAQFLDDVAPALLVCLLPLSFAYSILARRLFGIRLVIRRGLQHLLLSRGVLVADAIILFLIIEAMLRNSTAAAGPFGPALGGAIALAVVSILALVNRPLMQAFDRRFFRDRYDARRVMLGLGQELALLRDRDEILRRVGGAIVEALHPARVGVFLMGPGDGLTPAWSTDGAGTGAEAAVLGRRLAVEGNSASVTLDDPPRDGDSRPHALADPGPPGPPPYELCIPLRRSGRLSGCIALAAKRSEEPYTSEDRELLVTVANQAALALENAELLEVARREAQLAREVEIASEVQRNLFPRELPRLPGWEVAAVCRPARSVAGDYYDVVRSADGGLGLALGDVSGKGIGASLLSAGVHAMVRSRLPGRTCDLAALLDDLNTHLVESSADAMFATLVVARIDASSGRMAYVNAGHPPPLMVGAGGARWLNDGGPLAGVIRDARYAPGEARLEPGDLLVIYSDGVTEAEGADAELFGDERLLGAIEESRGLGAEAVMSAVLRAVEAFTGGAEPGDDVSLVVVRRIA